MKTFKAFVNDSYSVWKNEEPVKYAKHLEKTFGKPDELTNSRAIWFGKDGFKRIEVLDEYILHIAPTPHHDFCYAFVDLHVPTEYAEGLAKSSGSILIDYLKNEVGGRCATLTACAATIQYVINVVEGKVEPSKQEYKKEILNMHNMFDSGKHYKLDWWSDLTNDADPKNPYFKDDK